ncbi:MAG: DNA mismatch repair endonuclease MutL [Amedibacillus dolichus]|uniref:DNA mismatch repair protein MutL n=1 Tax=Amedibacillus dolichus TaxID=31971 RepID=A0A942WEM3_9FIRM|nr:DNA mismatch repair endonuclease MutL [Amedibacillus dolichus]MBS4883952.1 DNA mismatch repair endonuclease MutL [Amedibacillus dolichus]MEE0383828.1 DNA mismatch repair endonuclease MutL [Amedibacillus dolichus]
MARIHQLDEHLSNMIAAGEVVERPSGIVKELVENSIDAKAKHIEIQILQGGIDCITIIDDGCGMDAQDATLAFERHATSKIQAVDDLWKISTMGFRGEALPSIASVSQVTLRTNDGIDSSEVIIHYGTLKSARPCGTPKGTMLEVRNLFQKTPARFKHLKSPQYEFSLISDVVQKFAISHPNIGFELSHDGRSVFKTKGNGNLREVLMQIYGRDGAKTAIELHGQDLDYTIRGYALQPQFQRATKYYVLLYINGRMIRNYHLQKAVMDAYAPYMPKDRYPIAVINMEMDAQLVDVNVHPSKWEIRLSKEKQLEKLLYQTIKAALMQDMEVPNIQARKENKKEKIEIQELQFTYPRDQEVKKLHTEVNDSFVHYDGKPKQTITEESRVQVDKVEPQEAPVEAEKQESVDKKQELSESKSSDTQAPIKDQVIEEVSTTKQAETLFKDIAPIQEVVMKAEQEPASESVNPSLPQLHVIGQFHNSYILAEGEKGLYIIDQHAAQERYHYEMIQKQILSGVKDTQPLLIPITVETTISAVSRIDDLNALLEQVGIHFEVFGNTTLLCRELPIWLKDTKEEAFLQDMIDLWQKDDEISLDKLRKHTIATMACHSSIRFHRSLTMEEMKQVILDLGKCEQPFHCPHGRPTLICYEDKDLIHDFERG